MNDDGPIRVLRIIARMNVGGPAWQASALTRGLPDHGIETRLLAGTVEPGEEDFVSLRDPDLPVVTVPGLGRSVRLLGDIRALASLVTEMRRYRPHVVHTHTAKAGVLGRLAAALAGVPVRVHTFHGHLLYGYFPSLLTGLIVLVEKVLARRTTTIVAVGERVRDEVLAARIGEPDRMVAIAPGVAEPPAADRLAVRASFDIAAEASLVLFVGRLTSVKRVDRLLEAFTEVLESVPAAVLVVAGEGDRLEALTASASALGGSVRFIGWQADVHRLYAMADVMVIASDNEGMPVTLIEAAMMGVPAVTTDVGSASEVVVEGVTGRVVLPDARSLAAGLVDVLTNEGRRAEMGQAARARARSLFGADRLLADHAELYRQLLGQ